MANRWRIVSKTILFTILALLIALKGGTTGDLKKQKISWLNSMHRLVVKFWTYSLTYLLAQVQGSGGVLWSHGNCRSEINEKVFLVIGIMLQKALDFSTFSKLRPILQKIAKEWA